MKNKDFISIEKNYSLCRPNQHDAVFHKGSGVWLWDVEALQYFDLTTLQNYAIFGHSPSRLVQVLVEQAKNLSLNTNFLYTDRLGPFLKKLCEMTTFARCTAFSSTYQAYSEIIRYSLQRAALLKERSSTQMHTIFLSSRHVVANVPEGLFNACSFLSFDEFDQIEALEDNLSVIIIDLLDLNDPQLIVSQDKVNKAKAIAKRADALFIADESALPPGALGANFAFDFYPKNTFDGFILGEYLGAGITPLCAAGMTETVFEQVGGLTSSLSSIYPLGAAVALESLCMLEEFFLAEKAMSKGSRIQEVLMNRHAIKEIYSRGLIFKIIVQQETDMAVLREEFKQQQLFVHELDQTSFLLSPPLVMSEQELDFLIGKLMHIFPVVSMAETQVV